jgi:polyribonucleotide nucleotidyltransferase
MSRDFFFCPGAKVLRNKPPISRCGKAALVMVEAGAQQVSEEEVLGAIEYGHECCKKLAAVVKQIQDKCGKTKRIYKPAEIDQALYDQIAGVARVDLTDALNTEKYPKLESYAKIEAVKAKTMEVTIS